MTEKQPNIDVQPEDDDTDGRTDHQFDSSEPEHGGPKEDATRYGTWAKKGKEVDF